MAGDGRDGEGDEIIGCDEPGEGEGNPEVLGAVGED